MKKKKKAPKPPKPSPLDSGNWISESSGSKPAASGVARDAGSSGSGGGDPCDKNATPPKSIAEPDERPIVIKPAPPNDNRLGNTDYEHRPVFETSMFCDGKNGVWVRRVTSAWFQQNQWIKPTAEEITDAKIADPATNCGTLAAMAAALRTMMTQAAPLPAQTPRDVIQAHENVHKANTTAAVLQLYPGFVAEIDAISVPCDGNDFAAAIEATKAAVKAAEDKFDLRLRRKDLANSLHDPPGPFIAAHRAPALVWYEKVRTRMKAKGCPDEPDPPAPPN